MFHDRIRGLIDRHCLVLRDETGEIGKMLAQCNPYSEEAVDPQVIGMARAACQKVGGTSQAIGIPAIDHWAQELNRALIELEGQDDIEPWDMVRVMSLQGELAAAVDELEADRSALYSNCTTPEALEVAPMPEKASA